MKARALYTVIERSTDTLRYDCPTQRERSPLPCTQSERAALRYDCPTQRERSRQDGEAAAGHGLTFSEQSKTELTARDGKQATMMTVAVGYDWVVSAIAVEAYWLKHSSEHVCVCVLNYTATPTTFISHNLLAKCIKTFQYLLVIRLAGVLLMSNWGVLTDTLEEALARWGSWVDVMPEVSVHSREEWGHVWDMRGCM